MSYGLCCLCCSEPLFLLTQQGFSFASVSFVQMVAIGFISAPPPAVKLIALASFHLLASFGWCWRITPLSTFPDWLFNPTSTKQVFFCLFV